MYPLGLRRGVEPKARTPARLTAMSMRKYFCTFPQHLISEPIISHTLGVKFGVIPNIRSASISDTLAMVAVEIEGEDGAIDRSVAYLKERGVRVEEMVDDVASKGRPTRSNDR
jgi:hypothetical protein